jgi:hypothetical protein
MIKMSTETMIEMLFGIVLTCIGVQAILHEQELIRFERKVKKYVKAFVKALYYTIKERRDEKTHM